MLTHMTMHAAALWNGHGSLRDRYWHTEELQPVATQQEFEKKKRVMQRCPAVLAEMLAPKMWC